MAKDHWLVEKLNLGEKDELEVRGYRPSCAKFAGTLLAILLTGGVLLLFLLWRKDLKMKLMYEQCALNDATKVLLKDSFGLFYEETVRKDRTPDDESSASRRYFINKKLKYMWDGGLMQFVKIRHYDCGKSCNFFYDTFQRGLHPAAVQQAARLYGLNWIQIKVLPVYKLVMNHILNPLYLAQLYTTLIWLLEGYYDYTSVLLFLAVTAVVLGVRQTRKQMMALRKMFDVTGSVRVLRDATEVEISSVDLVPGDIIFIPAQGPHSLHCDAVLLEGTCSMDESVLTGESHPITKIPLPRDKNSAFDYDHQKRHVLFCGTQLMQGRGEGGQPFVKAVVIRTGFTSQKGDLVRGILFPKPVHIALYSEVIKCSAFFFFFGLAGMIYSMYYWAINGGTVAQIILHGLDIATIALPVAFPAAMTCINAFSQKRLKKNGIFCLNSNYVSIWGGIDVICFDKTGTLTENDLDVAGAIPIQDGAFQRPVEQVATLSEAHPLLVAMATCHSLIQLDSGQLGGYSTDQKMFQATGWVYEKGPEGLNPDFNCETPFTVTPPAASNPQDRSSSVAVLKVYPFESVLQKMTVITRRKRDIHHEVYVKGAPEAVASLCDPSTIPQNYGATLSYYTLQGFRVLALAAKTISDKATLADIQTMTRDELECNAELVGFLIIRNSVKKETLPAMMAIHQADCKTVMVTGDNLQTAITIGRESGLLAERERVIRVSAALASASVKAAQHLQVNFTDPLSQAEFIGGNMKKLRTVHDGEYCFAVDGSSFELLSRYDPALLRKVIHRGKIFARMAPAHKQELMEKLQELGHQVAMVGDGCNDCGALKAANVGVSLSMTDASVAAPFTSTVQNISCVPKLLREGRAAVTATFQTFIFSMAGGFLSFILTLFMYSIAAKPGDFQYLIWVYVLYMPPFFLYGITEPSSYLHSRRPIRHIWSFLPFLSFFSYLFWHTIVLTVGWFYCRSQPWFVPFEFAPGEFSAASYEETTMFLLMMMGTVAGAFIFAPGPPYTKYIFKSKVFTLWAVIAVVVTTCLIFISHPAYAEWMVFKPAPYPEYTAVIYVLGLSGGIVSYCCERYVIKGLLHQWLWPRINRLRPLRHGYQRVEMELRAKPQWPQLGQEEDVSLDRPDRVKSANPELDCAAAVARNTGSGLRHSFRDFLGRTSAPMSPGKMSFRTFRGKQASYVINESRDASAGSHLNRQVSSDVEIPIDMELTQLDFPPPPEEVFQMDEEIHMTGHRSLDNDEWKPVDKEPRQGSSDDDEVFLGRWKSELEFQDAQETVDDPGIQLPAYVPQPHDADGSPRDRNGSLE